MSVFSALLRSVQDETDIPSNALHNVLRGLQIATCSLLTAQEFFLSSNFKSKWSTKICEEID